MGQKINPQGFRVGVNNLWFAENQCYGKSFKNPKNLYKKSIFATNYLNQHFESKTLAKSKPQLKIIDNKWQCNLQYTSLLPKNDFDPQILKKLISKFLIIKLQSYNTPFWYQNGALLCEFITYCLKKGFAFRKAINFLKFLFIDKKNHKIVLKTVSGIQLFEFTGLKIKYTGRFGGSRNRMSSSTTFRMGAVPLQKLETHIEFNEILLYTKQGICNLQVWMAYKII
nr:ribosomal protein S3 [Pyropia sp. Myanmar_A]BED43688.1 ribosomal protein S3 [Pyropia sp. Myanmar_B]BED43712.1 ribosomal protein S3 [Pyropia sp. Myanmar_C]